MENPEIGWLAAIIIGGFAGWLAERVMASQMGVFMNILLGMIGAALGGFLFRLLGFAVAGWLGYLIAGFVGACILIWLGRMLRR
jgi:uncharacterized membrane protein YeaQ/YmgE (transglycosylase-associated protein family)